MAEGGVKELYNGLLGTADGYAAPSAAASGPNTALQTLTTYIPTEGLLYHLIVVAEPKRQDITFYGIPSAETSEYL